MKQKNSKMECKNSSYITPEKKSKMLIPYAVLCELTHRCPLSCPYCSNPVQLEMKSNEVSTEIWKKALTEAVKLGILQAHFSGGEPTARKDLEVLINHAAKEGLYTNLITSGVLVNEERLKKLYDSGLDHVQISIQDTDPENSEKIAGFKGHNKKLEVCKLVRKVGLPLTINSVMHRQNLHNLKSMIELAVELDAERLEVAQVQYYGWALKNQTAFLPTRKQLDNATKVVEEARIKYKGILAIDYVVPDYYAKKPKSCMGGWGRQFLNITPAGKVLPCHAAESLTFLDFENIKEKPLSWIWEHSQSFNRFRGTDWMPEPCRSCDRREIDWGGCRCQAFALTGNADAADPACEFSPYRNVLEEPLSKAGTDTPKFIYRKF
ncbi:MAG: pyrroloquinoline quinone biosynthesis protein PqqE [Alphaproteobacteria bacterium TMED93]|nr:MAG: pyrroloquinoline quinone biosynthesis protein PqqE [Alphaproteobacteria bacterium TMED93]